MIYGDKKQVKRTMVTHIVWITTNCYWWTLFIEQFILTTLVEHCVEARPLRLPANRQYLIDNVY